MIIEATAKFKMESYRSLMGTQHSLILITTFKHPGHLFRTKLKDDVVTTGLNNNETSKFIEDCINIINDKEKINNLVSKMINSYFEEEEYKMNKEKNMTDLKNSVADFNKQDFKIQVKIEKEVK